MMGNIHADASEENARANLKAVRSKMEALHERIKLLEAALLPFAEEANGWPDEYTDDENLVESFNGVSSTVTLGDCRRARSVLFPPTGDTK